MMSGMKHLMGRPVFPGETPLFAKAAYCMTSVLLHSVHTQQKVATTGFTLHLHEPFPHYIRRNVEADLIMGASSFTAVMS